MFLFFLCLLLFLLQDTTTVPAINTAEEVKMEHDNRWAEEGKEDVGRQYVYNAMSGGVVGLLERLCYRDWDKLEVDVSDCPLATLEEGSFNKLMHVYTNDHVRGMQFTFADAPPYNHVDLHFCQRCICMVVSPVASKRAAKGQTSGLSPWAVLSRLHVAWKAKFWHCRQHEPGGLAADSCPYCLRYRGYY